jgi:hypothetical protein
VIENVIEKVMGHDVKSDGTVMDKLWKSDGTVMEQ